MNKLFTIICPQVINMFIALPDSKIWTKLKAFADKNLILLKWWFFSVFESVENIVERRKSAGYQQFLFFLQCFHKYMISGSLKLMIVW